jgi:hypothetical protein
MANTTIVSYNASVVKIYNASNSIGRFYDVNHSPHCKNALVYKSGGVVVLNPKVVEFGPEICSYVLMPVHCQSCKNLLHNSVLRVIKNYLFPTLINTTCLLVCKNLKSFCSGCCIKSSFNNIK